MVGLANFITGDSPKPSTQPQPPAPIVMPTPDNQAINAAKQQQAAAAITQSGRMSTILTNRTNQSNNNNQSSTLG